MKHLSSKLKLSAIVLLLPLGAAFALNSYALAQTTNSNNTSVAKPGNSTLGPTTTGQPNQTCGTPSAPNTPGNSVSAPGSAFNPDGKAGTVYAGQQPQNSRNPVSVAQYDVACSHAP